MPIRKISTLPKPSDYDFRSDDTPQVGDLVQLSIDEGGDYNSTEVDYGEIREDIKELTLGSIDYATSAVSGSIYIASDADVVNGTDETKAVNPKQLVEYSDSATPYYTVKVNNTHNLTLPSQFTSNIAKFSEISMGSISHGLNNKTYTSVNSLLYTMNVNVLSNTTINFKLFVLDDYLFIYVDGVLKSSSHNYGNSNSPKILSFNISSGVRVIDIVKNDRGAGSNSFDLMGDIISDTVKFIKP